MICRCQGIFSQMAWFQDFQKYKRLRNLLRAQIIKRLNPRWIIYVEVLEL